MTEERRQHIFPLAFFARVRLVAILVMWLALGAVWGLAFLDRPERVLMGVLALLAGWGVAWEAGRLWGVRTPVAAFDNDRVTFGLWAGRHLEIPYRAITSLTAPGGWSVHAVFVNYELDGRGRTHAVFFRDVEAPAVFLETLSRALKEGTVDLRLGKVIASSQKADNDPWSHVGKAKQKDLFGYHDAE